jgi:NRPS condensation-like uncharacterized protein
MNQNNKEQDEPIHHFSNDKFGVLKLFLMLGNVYHKDRQSVKGPQQPKIQNLRNRGLFRPWLVSVRYIIHHSPVE